MFTSDTIIYTIYTANYLEKVSLYIYGYTQLYTHPLKSIHAQKKSTQGILWSAWVYTLFATHAWYAKYDNFTGGIYNHNHVAIIF